MVALHAIDVLYSLMGVGGFARSSAEQVPHSVKERLGHIVHDGRQFVIILLRMILHSSFTSFFSETNSRGSTPVIEPAFLMS